MKFREVPPHLRPSSEAGGNTHIAAGMSPDRNLIASVVDRWRAATMSQKNTFDDDGDLGSWRDDAVTTQMAPPAPPSFEPPHPEPNRLAFDPQWVSPDASRLGADPQRPSILRKPIGGDAAAAPAAPAPTRWR